AGAGYVAGEVAVALSYISQVIAERFKGVLLVRSEARVLATVFVKERRNRAEYLLAFSSSSSRCGS
ncbi:hypothetical protein ETB97_008835, partial [Aspergillus alliaceus]